MRVVVRLRDLPKALRLLPNFLKRAAAANAGLHKWHSAYFNKDPCVYCQKPVGKKLKLRGRNKWTIEHVTPIVDGGRDVAENLVHACYACNIARSNIPLLHWLVLRNQYKDSQKAASRWYRLIRKVGGRGHEKNRTH